MHTLKSLALASVAVLALSAAARADAINLTATVDGVAAGSASSPDGSLTVTNQSFGAFNLNSLSINSQTFLSSPGVLSSNTIDVDQNTTGSHTLQLDIVATGLAGPNAVQDFLSSFSVSGQTAGWSVVETTTINGVPLAATGLFTGVSDSASSINAAFAGTTFTADEHYTIMSVGEGSFNGGIDISVSAVPEPATWGMMLFGFVGLTFAFRNRRKMASPLAA
jgi:hypothetical protein